MLIIVLLDDPVVLLQSQSMGTPLRIELLLLLWVLILPTVEVQTHLPVIQLIKEGRLLLLRIENRNLPCPQETYHRTKSLSVSIYK